MKLRKTLVRGMLLFLLSMVVCPAIVVAQTASMKPESHCGSSDRGGEEKTPGMQCCLEDQDVLSVPFVHAPYEDIVLNLLTLIDGADRRNAAFAGHLDQVPYLNTGDHLTKLSTLRL